MKEWAKQTPRVARGIEQSDFTEAQFELMREMHADTTGFILWYLMKAIAEHPNSCGVDASDIHLRATYLAQRYGEPFVKAVKPVFDTTDLLTQGQLMERFTQSQMRLDALLNQQYETITQQSPKVASITSQNDFLKVGHDFYQRVFAYMKTAVMLQQAVSADNGRMH